MSVLDHLSAAPGVYWGEGQGPGGGRFVARVALQRHDDDSLTFDYEAWSPQGGLQHAESARLARVGPNVMLAATSNGGDDTMLFREGDPGVFGSVGAQRVGLVLTVDEQKLTFSWWWTGRDGALREQSRAVLAPMRQLVPPPAVPGHLVAVPDRPDGDSRHRGDAPVEERAGLQDDDDGDAVPLEGRGRHHVEVTTPEPVVAQGPATRGRDRGVVDFPETERFPAARARLPEADSPDSRDDVVQLITVAGHPDEPGDVSAAARDDSAQEESSQDEPETDDPRPGTVPWPGILVLNGPSTGLVAQRLAARLTRAAVVRTDLFDRAVRGTAGRPDPALRQRIALSVVQGYAATGHPVILHGTSTRSEHEALAAAISKAGLSPVKVVDVAEGEDYGEVARRLIESD